MTSNVLWIILAFAIGLGTSQSLEGSATTTEDIDHPPVDQCYINGVWYNPCTSDPDTPPQPPPPETLSPSGP